MTVLLGNESLQQFSLQRLVPEHHPHATATPWLSPNACRRGAFDDLELESPAARGRNETVTFGYPRERLLEQRVSKNLWLSATGAVLNGG
jgi:hypothetical protein